MKLARRRARSESETIIALIDVIFFLLVFFMLVGRMDATAPFDVVPPLGQTGADLPQGGTLIAVGERGALALDGGAVSRADLLADVASRVGRQPDTPIRLQAQATTELRHVLPLVAQLEALGASDIAFAVTPEAP